MITSGADRLSLIRRGRSSPTVSRTVDVRSAAVRGAFTRAGGDATFGGQSTFVLPLPGGSGRERFVFMADIWRPKNAIDGRYVLAADRMGATGRSCAGAIALDTGTYDPHRSACRRHALVRRRCASRRAGTQPATAILLPGYFADPSIVHDNGRWCIFATIDPWGDDRLALWTSTNGRIWTLLLDPRLADQGRRDEPEFRGTPRCGRRRWWRATAVVHVRLVGSEVGRYTVARRSRGAARMAATADRGRSTPGTT